MYLSHLSLTHFRNYQSLELDFTRPLALLQGENAQGKTNLLEAIYYIATSKPVHASTEREVVDWLAEAEPIPYCRVIATVIESAGSEERPTQIEIILTPRDGMPSAGVQNFKKQVKINGVNRRAIDLVGLMRTVLFLPEDIKLVAGSPGERRRYLDVALCQMDREYTRSLSRYQKVVTQRNSLLRNLREQGARAGDAATDAQLNFWDEQLVEHGAVVMAKRHQFVLQLEIIARKRHSELSGTRETLSLYYVPTFNPGLWNEQTYLALKDAKGVLAQPAFAPDGAPDGVAEGDSSNAIPALGHPAEETASGTTAKMAQLFVAKLKSRRGRELAAGITLYGPHRDDLRFFANGRDLRTYGSRGQQRTAALSLKLAEIQAMTDATGQAPILLLDDVMSELDAARRGTLLTALEGVQQAILTTTDWEDFSPEFREQAQLFSVDKGVVGVVEG